jgi:hypothetical protein
MVPDVVQKHAVKTSGECDMGSRVRDSISRGQWCGSVFVATLAIGGAAVISPGVYTSQFDVVLVAPTRNDNVLDGRSDRLTYLAGITAKSVSGDLDGTATVSDEVSLAGQGKLGWAVRQPNDGGQWTYWFRRPLLDVQIADHDEEAVRREIQEVIGRIRTDIDTRENAAGVADDNRVRMVVAPLAPEVAYNDGDRARAAVTVLALALLLAGATELLVRRFGTAGVIRVLSRLRRKREVATDPLMSDPLELGKRRWRANAPAVPHHRREP